ncbi:GntP family permease [Arthrobacter sp. zg-Y820]|uniref:GntP family permease n=1 Tax=unclassified Arthrobacter TaxID=235627 RepID=UPI001E53206B|nr:MULTISPECIES: GntP family permease [unclassified Arthrobacter]MCC9197398.1 GntP family permease [Arthrobacter sp. zg-Y820]MDK1280264.1 GntP family permease [Arthrobacter sp. zg.Y820]WIB09551.1 GntP family permease [Arthrobacter sp. zg-Y820]
MTIEGWSQTLGAGPLLLIAAGAIALLLFLILKLRLHAFVSLILVSLLTAFATGIPTSSVVTVLTGGFGSTLATVALLVGLGAMLGRLVETSGGAKVLAETLIRAFGEKRAPFALGVASLIFGFPIFFDAGLVVMLPVIFSVARRLGGGVLRYGLPAAGAFSVMHVFVPPHPGPVTASGFFEANIGVVLLVGLVVALPTWYVTSYLFGLWAGKKFVLPVPAVLGEIDGDEIKNPPKFGTVVAVLLLPLVLIFLNTGLNTLASASVISAEAAEQPWFAFLRTLGETPVALLISLLVACVVLGTRRGESKTAIEKVLESALGPVCSVILITGAGGMFGGVLRTSGIGDALGSVLSDLGVPLILAGFLIAAILRIAQGSATVALTTAAALIAPGVLEAGYNTIQTAAMVIAVAAGSVVVSHVNDSGFWLVGRFMGMDVKTTLKTWTVLETLIGVMGFAIAAVIFGLASLG